MQTDTPVYDTNKKARIAASEVSPHKHTHTKVWEYFYRSYLMWKTWQRVDPCLRAECESTHWVHSDTGITMFCAHTSNAWPRDLLGWFNPLHKLSVFFHDPLVKIYKTCNDVKILLSYCIPHSHLGIHTHANMCHFNNKDTIFFPLWLTVPM